MDCCGAGSGPQDVVFFPSHPRPAGAYSRPLSTSEDQMSTYPVDSTMPESRPNAATTPRRQGLTYRRYFTKAGKHPYEDVTWEMRSAVINDEKGQPVFEQHDIETPSFWSQTATNIVASKYFRGQLGSPERESSVRVLISRVVDAM